ncbi:hypothetical protein LV779_33105 [Streptomyces thinghirensis]|nr:hypothetical protein [Streptomyces thinghirensis]
MAYLMACLGGALGLRCTTRSMRVTRSWRPAWLALGSAAIGSGIWTMHFIAMMGFTIEHTPIRYDWLMTFASLAVAIVMVGIGIFIVGYRGARGTALFTGGTITGLGIASMHYLGMAGMRLDGQLTYQHVHRGRVRRHSHGRRHRRPVGGRTGPGIPVERRRQPGHGAGRHRHALHGHGRPRSPPPRHGRSLHRGARPRNCSPPCSSVPWPSSSSPASW